MSATPEAAQPLRANTASDASMRRSRVLRPLGVAGAVIAAAVALAFRAFGAARKGKRLLAEAATKPLHYTEHARCRMGCRCVVGAGEGDGEGGGRRVREGGRLGRRVWGHLASSSSSSLTFTHPHTHTAHPSHISPAQVRATLATGRVNPLKSDVDATPCAKLVVDAVVSGEGKGGGDGRKHVQAVVSACPRDTSVVTVIDTDRDWECYCPGD